MKSEIIKKVSIDIFKNLLILIVILILIIGITGIPIKFDIIEYHNRFIPNMKMSEITESIKNNFEIFANGQAFNTTIQEERIGDLLIRTIKKSSIIFFGGLILALIIGIPKGIIDSRKKDRAGTAKLLQSLIPLSLPDVLIIAIVQMIAYYLYSNNITFLGLGPIPALGDGGPLYAIYPIISIAIIPAAYIGRATANVIEEDFTKPYILTARGKGCSNFQIINKHMMKDIIYGILSSFPTILAIMFSSLVIVEKLYYYRGITFYLIYFNITNQLPPEKAGIGFTTFIVFLAIFYFVIFTIFNALKRVVLPMTKSH